MTNFSKKRNQGFSVVEILVAAGVFVTAVSVFLFAFGFLDDLSDRATERARAALLLEEGAEAVLLLRDQGWDTYIDALTEGDSYHLYYSGSTYATSQSEQLIFNTYFRTITVFSVNRDANDSYSVSGTDDPNTKRVRIEIIRAADDTVIASAEMLVHNAYE